MMEILKANKQNGNVNYNKNEGILLENETGKELIINHLFSKNIQGWLDAECPVISQNNFDTCGGSYSDGQYDIRNGYNQAYNTYLWEFENC